MNNYFSEINHLGSDWKVILFVLGLKCNNNRLQKHGWVQFVAKFRHSFERGGGYENMYYFAPDWNLGGDFGRNTHKHEE